MATNNQESMAQSATDGVSKLGKGAAKIAKAAAKKKSVAGAAVKTVGIKFVLIAMGILLCVLLLFGIILEVPAAISNSSMHINDAELLSASQNPDYFGMANDDVNGMEANAEAIQKAANKVIAKAKTSANRELAQAASDAGWTLRTPYDNATTLKREEWLAIYASYSATMGNMATENSNDFYSDNSALKDINDKLGQLVSIDNPSYSYGNYIVGADFVRDSSGAVIVTPVTKGLITTYYVDCTYYLDVGQIVQKAFSFSWDDNYDESSGFNNNTTYRDVINDMENIIGEMLYTDFDGSIYESDLGYGYTPDDLVNGSVLGTSNSEIVNMAMSQVGSSGEKFQSWWGCGTNTAWCAIFTSWCADKCGFVSEGICPKSSSSAMAQNSIRNYFKRLGEYHPHSSNYKPKAGDYIFIDWDADGSIDHVGLVRYSDAKSVYTVEGNRGKNGGHVITDDYSLLSSVIVGYASPSYPEADKAA